MQHIVNGKIAIEGHICPACKGRIVKYPTILCSLCHGEGPVDVVMTEEEIDTFNRKKDVEEE